MVGNSYKCVDCHSQIVDASGALLSTAVWYHVDKTYDVWGARITNYTFAADGGTCATTCHGSATPKWGANTADATCEKCHGSAATAAVGSFEDTSGSTTSAKAVTHVGHLAGTHNLKNPIECSSCHIVPTLVADAGHIDTSLPAEVNPSLGFGGTSCATSYCHGNAMPKGTTEGANRTPSWSDTGYLTGDPAHDCAQCHGYPPASLARAHAGKGPGECHFCHNNVNAAGDGFTALRKGPAPGWHFTCISRQLF